MNVEIICALISGSVTLLVSLLTWQTSVKKDREKTNAELRKTLDEHYERTQMDLQGIRDNLTDMGANLQQKIAILEVQLSHTNDNVVNLSNRVDKHNNVIERTFKLEQTVEDIKGDINMHKDMWK